MARIIKQYSDSTFLLDGVPRGKGYTAIARKTTDEANDVRVWAVSNSANIDALFVNEPVTNIIIQDTSGAVIANGATDSAEEVIGAMNDVFNVTAAGGSSVAGGVIFVAKKPNGDDAVFDTLNDLQTFYAAIDKPGSNQAAVVGTSSGGVVTDINVAYLWNPNAGEWQAIAVNFKGEQGDPGDPATLIDDVTPAADKTYSSNKIVEELRNPTKKFSDDASDDGRLRYDTATQKWYFETWNGSTWIEKFAVTGSATVDVVFIKQGTKPTVAAGELAFYGFNVPGIGTRPYFTVQNGDDFGFVVYNEQTGKVEYRTKAGVLGEVATKDAVDALKLNDLTDVNIDFSFSGFKFLRGNPLSETFTLERINLDDIFNVDTTGVEDGDILQYNASQNRWEAEVPRPNVGVFSLNEENNFDTLADVPFGIIFDSGGNATVRAVPVAKKDQDTLLVLNMNNDISDTITLTAVAPTTVGGSATRVIGAGKIAVFQYDEVSNDWRYGGSALILSEEEQNQINVKANTGDPDIVATTIVFKDETVNDLGGGIVEVINGKILQIAKLKTDTPETAKRLNFPNFTITDEGSNVYTLSINTTGSSILISDASFNPAEQATRINFRDGQVTNLGSGQFDVSYGEDLNYLTDNKAVTIPTDKNAVYIKYTNFATGTTINQALPLTFDIGTGTHIYFWNADDDISHNVIISAGGTDTIDGVTSYTLAGGSRVELVASEDGARWIIANTDVKDPVEFQSGAFKESTDLVTFNEDHFNLVGDKNEIGISLSFDPGQDSYTRIPQYYATVREPLTMDFTTSTLAQTIFLEDEIITDEIFVQDKISKTIDIPANSGVLFVSATIVNKTGIRPVTRYNYPQITFQLQWDDGTPIPDAIGGTLLRNTFDTSFKNNVFGRKTITGFIPNQTENKKLQISIRANQLCSFEIEDRTEGVSGLVLQAMTPTTKTSAALLQYSQDVQQSYLINHYNLDDKLLSSDRYLRGGAAFAYTDLGPDKNQLLPFDYLLYSGVGTVEWSKTAVGEDRILFLRSKGTGDNSVPYFGEILRSEVSKLLVGRTVTVVGNVGENTGAGATGLLMKWTGDPDDFAQNPTKIITGVSSNAYTFGANWEQIGIGTVGSGSPLNINFNTLVPSDVENIALIFAPTLKPSGDTPDQFELEISSFRLDMQTPFEAYLYTEKPYAPAQKPDPAVYEKPVSALYSHKQPVTVLLNDANSRRQDFNFDLDVVSDERLKNSIDNNTITIPTGLDTIYLSWTINSAGEFQQLSLPPSTGTLKMKLEFATGGTVIDYQGNNIERDIEFNAQTAELGKQTLSGFFNAPPVDTAYKLVMECDKNVTFLVGDRTEQGDSELLITELKDPDKSTLAFLQYQIDQGKSIAINKVDFANRIFNMKPFLSSVGSYGYETLTPDDSPVNGPFGFNLYNGLSSCQAKVNSASSTDPQIAFKNVSGKDNSYWHFGELLKNDLTVGLHDEFVTCYADIEVAAGTSGANLVLAKYTGEPNVIFFNYPKIITNVGGIPADDYTYDTDWEEVTKFPITTGRSTVSFQVQIPNDAVNIALIVVPRPDPVTRTIDPYEIIIRDLYMNINTPKSIYLEKDFAFTEITQDNLDVLSSMTRGQIIGGAAFDAERDGIITDIPWQFPSGSLYMGDTWISSAARTVQMQSSAMACQMMLLNQELEQTDFAPAYMFDKTQTAQDELVQATVDSVYQGPKEIKVKYIKQGNGVWNFLYFKPGATVTDPFKVEIRFINSDENPVYEEIVKPDRLMDMGGGVYRYWMSHCPILEDGDEVFIKFKDVALLGGQFDGSDTIRFGDPANSNFFPWIKFNEIPIVYKEIASVDYVDSAKDVIKLNPTTAPSTPQAGWIYYDSGDNKLKCFNGTIWNDLF